MLERLYARLNRREFVHPDPLEFLYRFGDVRDREIAALVAASLAFGRVAQILNRLTVVFGLMGPSPRRFLETSSAACVRETFAGFRHRFVDEHEFVSLLAGIRRVVDRHGTLNACFLSGLDDADVTVLPALGHFVRELGVTSSYLVPDPARGSAAKRLQLFLRWMVRSDAVDPGGWVGIRPAQLVVPLDTHMAKIGHRFRLTRRKSPGRGMALDITAAFRRLNPADPVKYDFTLTRFGIHPDLDWHDLDAEST